jgi:Tfp pilus assembly protein PilO
MASDFSVKKRLILGALGLLVAADAALIGYSLHNASVSGAPQETLAAASLELKLLKADVERGQKIRKEMPAIQEECDRFEKAMPPVTTGYSTVVAELGEIARKAGVQIAGVAFHESQVQDRPFSQVNLDLSIEGRYADVVRFLNGVQKTRGLYIVNELSLGAGSQSAGGSLRVNLRMQTYFRTFV